MYIPGIPPNLKSKFQPKKEWICLDYLTITKQNKHKFQKKKHAMVFSYLPKKQTHTQNWPQNFPQAFPWLFCFIDLVMSIYLSSLPASFLPEMARRDLGWLRGLSPNSSPQEEFLEGGGACSISNPNKKTLSIYVRGKITIDSTGLHWISYFTYRFQATFYDDKMGIWKTKSKWGNSKNPPDLQVRLFEESTDLQLETSIFYQQFSTPKRNRNRKRNNGNLQLNPSFLTPFSLFIPLQPLRHDMGDHQCRCFLSPYLASPSMRWPVSNNSCWEEMLVVS